MKNFLYLDVEKMYSLSSQVFAGVTEYVISESSAQREDVTSQDGPHGSGRVVGDILRKEGRQSEKRFLHDHSYVLFEDALRSAGKVIDVGTDFSEGDRGSAEDRKFIKVRARGMFNDADSLIYMVENMNTMGKALTHVTSRPDIERINRDLQSTLEGVKDKNQRDKLRREAAKHTSIASRAKSAGLLHDDDWVNSLAFLLKYGFQGQLEIQLFRDESFYTASLKKDCLREDESLLIRKYGRKASVDFVLFGIITQCPHFEDGPELPGGGDSVHIRHALMEMVDRQIDVDNQFFGRLENEFIIDPIALYTEI